MSAFAILKRTSTVGTLCQTDTPYAETNLVALAAGERHSLGLKDDGTVVGWGNNYFGQTSSPPGLNDVIAIDAGQSHSLALKSDGTVVGWGASSTGTTNPPAGLSNVLAIAAGEDYSLALKNDGTVVAWGTPHFGVTNVPVLFDVYAIAAGFNHALALTYSPVLNYVIESSRDLLLVCNTNCADSVAVMNYYRTNRPMVADANVLGIGGATTNAERYTTRLDMTNTIVTPVRAWLANNPTKRPNYVILFYGVPANNTAEDENLDNLISTSVTLHRIVNPHRRPFVTHVNMRTPQDCFGYVDKLANFGTNYSPGRVYISASAGGYSGTNYFFDDVRGPSINLPGIWPGACASNAVINFGSSANQITYVVCTNLDANNNIAANCFNAHLFNCTNVAGYFSWGYPGGLVTGFPTNGWVRFYGSSGWYVLQTPESWNGEWIPHDYQTTFHDYFTSGAFWGTNYSNTPVGTVTHTDEPSISQGCPGPYGGVASPHYFFGFWQARKNFAVCAWTARGTTYFQAVGDPFLTK